MDGSQSFLAALANIGGEEVAVRFVASAPPRRSIRSAPWGFFETEQAYFLRRMRASVAMAEAASSAMAKLAHFELAGRYSAAAAQASSLPDTLR